MEQLFSSINYSDPLWIIVAFLFGALSRAINLPPLVGFLIAGFSLNYLGAEGGDFLNEMADLGITLLLFAIGLKLKLKELLYIEIWGGALAHILLFSAISVLSLSVLSELKISLFSQLTIINIVVISFALSFSSTVFVVKNLEEQRELNSKYGQIAIGVLIIQDLVAVFYLGVSESKIPSIWAALLIVTILVFRPLIIKLMMFIGRGELLLLFGLTMALGGATLFELVDVKADLGALVFGILLANTPRAKELANALFSIKELFLVGFFLSIGLAGLPDITTILVVIILLLLLIIKSGLFFFLLSWFKIPTFTSSKSALALGNYSEFGLIVMIVAVSQNWIENEWLVVMAVLVASSFVVSSIINSQFDRIFEKNQNWLSKFERKTVQHQNFKKDIKDAEVLIYGIGRVGIGAYDYLKDQKRVVAIGIDKELVDAHNLVGRKSIYANMNSAEFWSQADIKNSKVRWILMCTPDIESNKEATLLARKWGYSGRINAVSFFHDEEAILKKSGVDAVFNIYKEAGSGLAQHGLNLLSEQDGEGTH